MSSLAGQSAVAPRAAPSSARRGACALFTEQGVTVLSFSAPAVGRQIQRQWTVELPASIGETIVLQGWLHRLRQLANVTFLVLRDAQGLAQVVIDDSELAAKVAGWHHESVIAATGRVVATPQAPGGVELRASRVDMIAPAVAPPPFDLFRPAVSAQLPTRLDHAAVTLRHPRVRARHRLAAELVAAFRESLTTRRYVEIFTPKLVGAATESGANVFALDYFGQTAYLAQSPQLYKQIMVGVHERVFEVGPVFRAEPHDTPRHLNTYTSLDVELGFIDNHTTVMRELTDTLRDMMARVSECAASDLALLECAPPVIPAEIPAIHFTDAQALIATATGDDTILSEPDLAPADERWLGEWAKREHDSDFLFVVGYPLSKRPFYTHPDPERPGASRGFDLLFRGLELVTGGQRLHRYGDCLIALTAKGIDHADFAGYLEAFRHGMPPHGGFAIGLERLVARLLTFDNVRETTLFPRDLTRLTP